MIFLLCSAFSLLANIFPALALRLSLSVSPFSCTVTLFITNSLHATRKQAPLIPFWHCLLAGWLAGWLEWLCSWPSPILDMPNANATPRQGIFVNTIFTCVFTKRCDSSQHQRQPHRTTFSQNRERILYYARRTCSSIHRDTCMYLTEFSNLSRFADSLARAKLWTS